MPVKLIVEKGRVPVHIYTDDIESEALQQLTNISQLPFIHHHVAAMPDVHAGIGATVGSVIPTRGAIVPAAVGVDIGCFVGSTKVALLNVKKGTATLQELAEQGGEHWVFAAHRPPPIEGMIEGFLISGAPATAHLTRQQAELMRVVLDNDAEIICTPDHQFLTIEGMWCEAQELNEDVLLEAFDTKENRFHQIKLTEKLDYREDVYCMTVHHYGNFALAAGVFVHNCGMNAVRLSLSANQLPYNMKKVRDAIEEAIPVGFNMHSSPQSDSATLKQLNTGVTQLFDKHPTVDKMLKNAYKTWTQQLGTLGSGNHFIEICLDESQHVWVMLHSGSRGIGNVIGTYFIGLAKRDLEDQLGQLPHKDLAYFREGSDHFDDYVDAVQWAQDYAMHNRREMMRLILQVLRTQLPEFEITKEAINCHHNYVAIEEHFGARVYLTRKGAISAKQGELGIIPGSMGAKSYIVQGKGNADSFCSCSHGAGRRMSRTEAKRRFSHRDLEQQTMGVECRKDKGVVDEIPAAYKDIDVVMANQNDLVDVVHTLKQIVCVKG
jgi:tRNA-splicing ligase RtcB (3'-phosphate/5'-hydroxy nucleic acid ligase)